MELEGPECGAQVVTRSFTPSTNRSTASTLCFAAVAPCCSTALATRLIRVTGDCFRAARLVGRFEADFFAAPERAATFGALFRLVPVVFAADFALLFLAAVPDLPVLPRAAVPFDAAADLPRDFPPDDFDRVAIIEFLEGRYRTSLRKIRAQCRVR